MAAAEARGKFPAVLDDAENGTTTVILRHSRPAAAVVPASELEAYNIVRAILRDVGESLDISRDEDIIAAVRRSRDEIARGEIVWDTGD